MCFWRNKDDIQDELPARPAHFAPPQITYATTPPKASLPAPVSPLSPSPSPSLPSPLSPPYQQHAPPPQQDPYLQPPPQQQQPPPIAELDSSMPVELAADDVAPPPGPPPSRVRAVDGSSRSLAAGGSGEYEPPPGPPPSHRPGGADDYDYTAPPPGPPPPDEPPQHDWERAVPDTSLLPPPPDIFSGHDQSTAFNATEAEAEAGERWCAQHPLEAPAVLDEAAQEARRRHDFQLVCPGAGAGAGNGSGFRGSLQRTAPGVWRGRTDKQAGDSCILGSPPLYAATRDSPLALRLGGKGGTGVGGMRKTMYYEVRIAADSEDEAVGLAIGYAALPYPGFRMPGWHRGSLAVHGDDGHRYVNDRWGGRGFTEPMRRGGTYGLGMAFTADAQGRLEVEVFFTRDGRPDGRWDLHEETDADTDLPVTGLEGFHDLSCAVGTFGAVGFEVVLDPARWLYRGEEVSLYFS